MIHIDTHVAVWIFNRQTQRLPSEIRRLLRRETVRMSPMALFEYDRLVERGRFPRPADALVTYLSAQIGLRLSDCAFATIIERARRFAWTRDPFDRLIVANAMADGARLVTADRRILENFADAVW